MERLHERVIAEVKAELNSELDLLLAGEKPPTIKRARLHKPTEHEIEAFAWGLIRLDLRSDENERQTYPDAERQSELHTKISEKISEVAAGITDPQRARLAALAAVLDELTELDRPALRRERRKYEREALAADTSEAIVGLAEAIVIEQQWDVPRDSPEFFKLCMRVRSARLHALAAIEARDRGDFLSAIANPTEPDHVTAGKVVALKQRAKVGETLVDLLPQYLADEGVRLSSEEREKKKKVVKLFAEFVGLERNVATITRVDFRDFKLKLKKWPRVANNQSAFKGKDFNAIVKKNEQIGGRTIGQATVNNYLSSLGAFFGWLFRNSYTSEANITHGLLVKRDRDAAARDPYSAADLEQIFSLPIFTGSASLDDIATPGKTRVNDWRFWIPVLCAYSGARLGEIAQLRVEDVKKVGTHQTWALHITDEGEGMAVKTRGSVRIVPVHAELIRLGFPKYRELIAKEGFERLFPELQADKHGRFAGGITEWWRGYTARFKIQGTNAYRFRHTFADALRAAGILDNEIGPILGHKEGTTTERYGVLPQGTVDRRAEIVNAVQLPIALTPPTRVE